MPHVRAGSAVYRTSVRATWVRLCDLCGLFVKPCRAGVFAGGTAGLFAEVWFRSMGWPLPEC